MINITKAQTSFLLLIWSGVSLFYLLTSFSKTPLVFNKENETRIPERRSVLKGLAALGAITAAAIYGPSINDSMREYMQDTQSRARIRRAEQNTPPGASTRPLPTNP